MMSRSATNCYETVFSDKENYVLQAISESDFQRAEPISEGKLILLSTCANETNQSRYVLHGVLVPLDSAR